MADSGPAAPVTGTADSSEPSVRYRGNRSTDSEGDTGMNVTASHLSPPLTPPPPPYSHTFLPSPRHSTPVRIITAVPYHRVSHPGGVFPTDTSGGVPVDELTTPNDHTHQRMLNHLNTLTIRMTSL